MDKLTYIKLLRTAQQLTKRFDEAEDLLQAILLAAVGAGRADMTCAANRNWLIGALRKRALFDARSAIRRRRREASYVAIGSVLNTSEPLPTHFIDALPRALRTTTLLALTGHTRKEIAWLLRISDPALRQRIVEIRRRWRNVEGHSIAEIPGLSGELAFGRLRKSMFKPMRREGAVLASHDPDGHIFIMTSQNHVARQQAYISKTTEE